MDAYVVTEAELREVVPLDARDVARIGEGFARLASGDVDQPPILRVDVPEHHGELDVKAAHVHGWDAFAVKMSTGFFDNPTRGLPTSFGLMVLISAETGVTKAVLLDNGYLTRIRTALAGALAADLLARSDAAVAAILGAGDQARWQLRALRLVRDIERVRVWARRADRAETYAAEMAAELDLEVTPERRAQDVVRDADVVVTATPSTEPIVDASWLRPGMHVTAMGSDAESKRELSAGVLTAADLVVCDHPPQSHRLGELRALDDAARASLAGPVPLGDIVSGTHPGRTDDTWITVCDLTGTGVQDTVIARIAYQRCRQARLGTTVRLR